MVTTMVLRLFLRGFLRTSDSLLNRLFRGRWLDRELYSLIHNQLLSNLGADEINMKAGL